jgi:DNA-binding CsgD family transcriptional regulator
MGSGTRRRSAVLCMWDVMSQGETSDVRSRLAATDSITLSAREVQVLQWAAEGKSEWEIGVILGLSEHTAEKFIRSARVKLRAVNRTHAVARAIKLGLIA